MKSNLLTFSFHCVVSKKSSLTQCYLNFLCHLLNFIVLGFTFGSVINFELIIIECIYKVCIQIHFLACRCPVVPAPFVEKIIFSPLNCIYFFVKDQMTIFVSFYFWALYSDPLIYLS